MGRVRTYRALCCRTMVAFHKELRVSLTIADEVMFRNKISSGGVFWRSVFTSRRSRTQGSRGHFCGTLRTFVGLPPCGDEPAGGSAAALPYLSKRKLTVERCNGRRCSLIKNVVPSGFIRARSFNHMPIARSSSPRKGWVVYSPPFNRRTCNTPLSVSTWSSFNPHASDTRKPCRNMRSNRQRSRASFLPPLTASIRCSTSCPVR
jgi:hypothetical protein